MGFLVKLVANPLFTRLASKAIDKVLNIGRKNGPVSNKVAATTAAGSVVTVLLAVIALFDPQLSQLLGDAGLAATVAGVITLISTLVGYFSDDQDIQSGM